MKKSAKAGRVGRLMGARIRFGRLGMPLWSVALAAVTVAAAAGQAVGPVLAGSTTGTVSLVISQSITLDTDLTLGSNPATSGADDSVSTRSADGTRFTAALELHQGQIVLIDVYLQNRSGQDSPAVLQLNVPSGIDVSLAEISDASVGQTTIVSEAMMDRDSWLMSLKSTAGQGDNDGVRVTIRPRFDIKPGFYTITGRIVPYGSGASSCGGFNGIRFSSGC